MSQLRAILLTAIIGLLPAVGVSLPETILAADVTVGAGDYACTREGLAAAIAAVGDGGTVTFTCDDPQIAITSEITITGTVIIDGRNSGDGIILDGGGTNRIFTIASSAMVTLQRLTLQRGQTVQAGEVGRGGAINNEGTLTIIQSSFRNNQTADDGGAINNEGTLTITQSSFSNNQAAEDAGAILNQIGSLEISQTTFINNQAATVGGAIRTVLGTLEITSSSFSGNTAPTASTILLSFLRPATAIIRWSTIVQPQGASPAIYNFNIPLTLKGVILAGPGDNCEFFDISSDAITIDSYMLADDDSCQLDTGGTSRVIPDLDLGEPTTTTIAGVAQTYYPIAGLVPAIDAGGTDCATVPKGEDGPATDQLGTPRPQGAACDIGAIERLIPDPIDLCANRWDGDLRMPSSDRCASTETTLHIAPDSPVTLCANRWTGEARYSPYDHCRSTETSYEAVGDNSIPVCVNRWDGTVRVSQRCYTTEWGDAL